MHETACIKCNAVSILPFYVAAPDSLKANLNLINLFFYTGGGASHQHGWIAIVRMRKVDRDRAIVTLQSPEDRSDGVEGLWKNSTIAVQSNRDRGTIEPRSGSLHGGIAANRAGVDRRTTRTTIVARSWRDRGPIAARSWPDHG